MIDRYVRIVLLKLMLFGTVPHAIVVSILKAQNNGVLRVHPTNPRYFTDNSGEAILLTGSHTWSSLQDNGNGNPPPAFPFDAYLDSLVLWNHNFFRLWTWEQARWSGETFDNSYWFSPHYYVRTGPGTALDGLPKWDLTQFNQAYFDTMRSRIIRARDRGMFVSIMLFNGWSVQTQYVNEAKGGLDPYKGHPFYVSNNINSLDGDAFPVGDGRSIHTLYNPAVTAYQLAYVKRVIDEVNDLDNVLYEICNEAYTLSTAWQYVIIDSIHAYESRKPKQHPVGMTAQWPEVEDIITNDKMFASNADWISPNWRYYSESMPPATGEKVIILDTDHIWGVGGDRTWAWSAFMRGLNPIYMDVYDTAAYGCGASDFLDPSPGYSGNWSSIISLRKNLGYIRSYAQRMNLAAMVPSGNLVTYPGYCLANPSPSGGEYLVYVREATNVSVNLTGGPSQLIVEWFNSATGETVLGGTVAGGAWRSFTSPFSNDAVLYLYDETLLPVELISFTGTPIGFSAIKLEWETTTEINNHGFVIERKKRTASSFSEVQNSFIQGNGTSNVAHRYYFIDKNVASGEYSYRLKQIDNDGSWNYTHTVNVNLLPQQTILKQNYPNPFNASTVISFALPAQSTVSLMIYNMLGQRVRTLSIGIMTAGEHSLTWNGKNDNGIDVESGVYFCKLTTNTRSLIRKVMILR